MQKLTLSESMEYFVNIKTGFCTCRKIGTALLSCVSMCLLITHCLVCNIRLIPCDHDWDFLRKILFKFRDPLIHLLESVGICAIIDNDGSYYNHWVRIYLRLHDSKPGWVRDIFLVPQCPRSPSWGSSHQPSQLWKESMKQDFWLLFHASSIHSDLLLLVELSMNEPVCNRSLPDSCYFDSKDWVVWDLPSPRTTTLAGLIFFSISQIFIILL
jgi:hypothetical protein